MRWLLFDDGQHTLGPLADLRPVFDVRTGIVTTRERWERTLGSPPIALSLPARLRPLVVETSTTIAPGQPVLCINGCWLSAERVPELRPGEALVTEDESILLAACLAGEDARRFIEHHELPDSLQRQPLPGATVLRHPWDVIRHRDALIARDAARVIMPEALIPADFAFVEGGHPIMIHPQARLARTAYLDATQGPIIVEEQAVVRPGAILCGPCFVGRGSTIVDLAHLKPNTVIGPVCKVGGEVGGTIFQGYANKSHAGHLGDSWVGEWANFGAGTTNSNLLNTYGEITARTEIDGPRLRTGLQFFGAVVGDHAKFAIETRLMTGSIIGTGAMIATTAAPPTTVRRFAWLTDEGERAYRVEKFIEVARAVMARRQVELAPAYEEIIRALHAKAARIG